MPEHFAVAERHGDGSKEDILHEHELLQVPACADVWWEMTGEVVVGHVQRLQTVIAKPGWEMTGEIVVAHVQLLETAVLAKSSWEMTGEIVVPEPQHLKVQQVGDELRYYAMR